MHVVCTKHMIKQPDASQQRICCPLIHSYTHVLYQTLTRFWSLTVVLRFVSARDKGQEQAGHTIYIVYILEPDTFAQVMVAG